MLINTEIVQSFSKEDGGIIIVTDQILMGRTLLATMLQMQME